MQPLSLFGLSLLSFSLLACSKQQEAEPQAVDHPTEAKASPQSHPFDERKPKLTYGRDVSGILASEDDYINTLSTFDYAAKFKSDTPLDYEQRKEAYAAALQDYTQEEIARLEAAFEEVFIRMEGMTVKLPEEIHIFSEEGIESGAAYTRANTICMPKVFIGRLNNEQLTMLAAHEMFHVISRHNLELRPAIYAILGFKPVQAPELPEPLASRTIANPDAPGMNYVIRGRWRGQDHHFLPILHSERPYDGGVFFQYLKDDLLAVEVDDSRTRVLMEDGKAMIAKKKDVEGYFEQVGENTHYNFHPEETSADHFMLLLMMENDPLPDPDKIKALGKILWQ